MYLSSLSFTAFNYAEAGIWFLFALLFFGISFYFTRVMPKIFWWLAVLNFVLFGVSDMVEAYFGVVFVTPEGYWLYIWKILCLVSFGFLFLWYVYTIAKKYLLHLK